MVVSRETEVGFTGPDDWFDYFTRPLPPNRNYELPPLRPRRRDQQPDSAPMSQPYTRSFPPAPHPPACCSPRATQPRPQALTRQIPPQPSATSNIPLPHGDQHHASSPSSSIPIGHKLSQRHQSSSRSK